MHIRIVEGEGSIVAAGARAPKGLIVEITDETGRPLDGAAVSFRMPEEGPGATFAGGMRTEIRTTTPDGRASVHDFTAGRLTGPYQVRVTAVKNGVRAGTVVSQYVADAPVRGASARSGSTRRWLLIAVAAGCAAAGGAGAAMASRGNAGAAAPPPQLPTIGAPSMTVGRP